MGMTAIFNISTAYISVSALYCQNQVNMYAHIAYRFSLSVENEQADAGRDGQTRLATTKFSGTNGDREISTFPVQLTTSRIDNLTRLIYTLLYVMTIHGVKY